VREHRTVADSSPRERCRVVCGRPAKR
jgi:hypothetical protein